MSSAIRMLKERKSTYGKRNIGEKIGPLDLTEKFYLTEQCHHPLCKVDIKVIFYLHDHCLAMNPVQGGEYGGLKRESKCTTTSIKCDTERGQVCKLVF